jgi:FAD synthase
MLITHGSSDAVLPAVARPSAIDGIHRHQAMLQRLIACAQARPDGRVLTGFHPREFFAPQAAPRPDFTARTRAARGARGGTRACSAFRPPFAALAGGVEQVLAKRLRARWL